jgi:hypothetical protein
VGVMAAVLVMVVLVAMEAVMAASDIAHWAFRMALFTAGLALICFAAWFALWGAGRLFANMYPRKKIEK